MSMQKLRLSWALFLAIVSATLVLAAPAPDDEPVPDELKVEPAKATEEEADQNLKASELNLKNIALALHNFVAVNGGKIPHDVRDKDGKALLSWRVELLPYLEQDKLYKEFKLDEAWNSEHNKPLVEKMPDVFSSPRVVVKKKGFTVYQGFDGPGAIFEAGQKLRLPASIPDGTSNTILAVESSVAVPWTKPVDLPFDVKKDLPDIGKAYGAKPLAAICDGSVRTLNLKTLTPETFKNAIMRADGNVLGADW